MKDETKKLLEESIMVKKVRKSYLKKDEFIEMINKLNFTEVKMARIEFITGYEIKNIDNGKPYVNTLGYEIEIT